MPTPGLRAITDDNPTPSPPPPARSGEPWTDEDYERLVALLREGADHQGIAEGLQRPMSTVGVRVRRLLPVQERRCPADRVLVAARGHLSDPAYDWRHVMLLSEPPRPPVAPPAPAVREGVRGLDDADLITVAYSLLRAFRDSETRLLREVAGEVEGRGIVHRLVRRRVDRLLHGNDEAAVMLLRSDVDRTAWEWVMDAPAWRPRHDEPGPWGYDPSEDDDEPWSGPMH